MKILLLRPLSVLIAGGVLAALLSPGLVRAAANRSDIRPGGNSGGVSAASQEIRSASESLAQVDGMSDQSEGYLVEYTDVLFHWGDYPRIVGVDRIITEIDPANEEAYATGGYLLESLGQNDYAEAYYNLGLKRNPKSDDIGYTLGMFYFHVRHNYQAAISTFTRCTHDPAGDVNDWKMLAHSYTAAKKYADAVSTWQYIKVHYPKAPAVDSNMHEAEQQLAAHEGLPTPVNAAPAAATQN